MADSQSQKAAPVQEWRGAWQQLQQTPEYQEAGDKDRQAMRIGVFREYIAPNISNLDIERGLAIFNAQTAPRGDANSGLLGDAVKLLKSGGQGTTADIAQGATLGHKNAAADTLREWQSENMESLSPTTLKDVEAFGFEKDENGLFGYGLKEGSTWRGGAASVVQGLGSLIPSFVPGGILGKVLGVGGKALAGTGKAVGAARKYKTADDALAIGTKIEKATMIAGQSTAMGGMIMGGTANQTYEDYINQPKAELMKSPEFRQHLQDASNAIGNDDPELAMLEARRRGAEEASLKNRLPSFGVGAASGFTNVSQLNLLRGMGSASRIGGAGKSGLLEAGQEAWESGGQQYITNKSIAESGIEREAMKGVGAAALTGAALGFAIGAPLGAIAKPKQAQTPEQEAETRKSLENNLKGYEAESDKVEADLDQTDLDPELKLQYEAKLETLYRKRYDVERIMNGLPPVPRTHDPVNADPDRELVPPDIDEKIKEDEKIKSDAQQSLKREMKNGGDASTVQRREKEIGKQSHKINIESAMADNRGNSKYFNTQEEFVDWLIRTKEGGNSEFVAQAELLERKAEYEQSLNQSLNQSRPSLEDSRKEANQLKREQLAERVRSTAGQVLGTHQRKQQFEKLKEEHQALGMQQEPAPKSRPSPTPAFVSKPASTPGTFDSTPERQIAGLQHLQKRLEDSGNTQASTRLRGIIGAMASHGNLTTTIEGQQLEIRSGKVDPKQLRSLTQALAKKAPRTKAQHKKMITDAAVRKMKDIGKQYASDGDGKTGKLKKLIERVTHVLEKKGVMRQKYGDGQELYINRGEVSAKDLNDFIKWLQSQENATPGYWRARLKELASDLRQQPGKAAITRGVLLSMRERGTKTVRYGGGKTLQLDRGIPDYQDMVEFVSWLKPAGKVPQKTEAQPKRYGLKGDSGLQKHAVDAAVKRRKQQIKEEREAETKERLSEYYQERTKRGLETLDERIKRRQAEWKAKREARKAELRSRIAKTDKILATTKEGQRKEQYRQQGFTHIWTNPETGKKEPVSYEGPEYGSELYSDRDGNEVIGHPSSFEKIEGAANPVAEIETETEASTDTEEDETARQDEDARREQESAQEEKERKSAFDKSEKEKAKHQREMDEYKQELQDKKDADKQLKEDTRKTREKISVRSRELVKDDPDLAPRTEPAPWKEVRPNVSGRTGNSNARTVSWAKSLEDAYKKLAGWSDQLIYADENIAIFSGTRRNREIRYVVRQPDAAKHIAWAELSGQRETSPVYRHYSADSIVDMLKKSNDSADYDVLNTLAGAHPDGLGDGLKYVKDAPDVPKWKGGWRGAVTRPLTEMAKPASKRVAEKPVSENPKFPAINELESTGQLTGTEINKTARIMGVAKKKKGESTADSGNRIKQNYQLYQSLQEQTVDSLNDRYSKAELVAMAKEVGVHKSIYRKEQIGHNLIDWRNKIVNRIKIYDQAVSLKDQLKALLKNNMAIPMESAIKLNGKHGWIYTDGDQDVAAIVGDEYLNPKGQRGDNESLYELAEDLLNGNKEAELSRLLNDNPDVLGMVQKVKSIRGSAGAETIGSLVDFTPAAKTIGVSDQYAKEFGERFAPELSQLVADLSEKPVQKTEKSKQEGSTATVAVPGSDIKLEEGQQRQEKGGSSGTASKKKLTKPVLMAMEQYRENDQFMDDINSGKASKQYLTQGDASTPNTLTSKGEKKLESLQKSNDKLLAQITKAAEKYPDEESWSAAVDASGQSPDLWSWNELDIESSSNNDQITAPTAATPFPDLDDLLPPTSNKLKELNPETAAAVAQERTEQTTGSRGITEESGSWKGMDYQRTARVSEVSPTPKGYAEFIHNLQNGDLLIDKFGNTRGVVAVKKSNYVKVYGRDAEGKHTDYVMNASQVLSNKNDKVAFKTEIDRLTSGGTITPEPVVQPAIETAPTDRQKRKRKRSGKIIEIDQALMDSSKELAEAFRKQAGKLTSGVDPLFIADVLRLGTKTGILMIQKGAVKFANWADNMLAVYESHGIEPDQVTPYLKELYGSVSNSSQISDEQADQMDDSRTVRRFDMDSLLEEESRGIDEIIVDAKDLFSGDPEKIGEKTAVFMDDFLSVINNASEEAARDDDTGSFILSKATPVRVGIFEQLPDDIQSAMKEAALINMESRLAGKNKLEKIAKGEHELNINDIILEMKWAGYSKAFTGLRSGLKKMKEAAEGFKKADPYSVALPPKSPERVEHTTKKGNLLKGIIRDDLTKPEALAIDPHTFRKDGGWFIREKYLTEPPPDIQTVKQDADLPPAATPTKLSQAIYQHFQAGNTFKDNRELKKFVAEQKGITASEVTPPMMKKAQEATEVALVLQSREIVAEQREERDTYDRLVGQYEGQPLLNMRSGESIEQQAYSTPAPLAYLAGQLAGISQTTSVYEPTAGNGMLLIGADVSKSTVNELNSHRAENLSDIGYTPTMHDALAYVPAKQHDAMITNPPFGRTDTVKMDGYNLSRLEHVIAANALKSMKDDGKASIIIGANKEPGRIGESDRIFFNWLYSHYNVVAHFEVDGDLYKRQGAGWPVQIIAVDGRQQSNKKSPASNTIQRFKSWNEIYDHYRTVMDTIGQQSDGRGKSDTVSPDSTGDTAGSVSTPRSVIDKITGAGRGNDSGGRRAETTGGSSTDSGRPAITGSQRGAVSTTEQPARNITEEQGGVSADGSQRSGDIGKSGGTRPTNSTGGTVKPGVNASSYQVSYNTASGGFNDTVLTPVNMSINTDKALRTIQEDVGSIDQYVMDKLGYDSEEALYKAFMGLQVDTIAAAIHNAETKNKGIIIADQTGVGKGRQAAGIIRYAKNQGKIPVFVTVKDNLFTDMYNDLDDVGTNDVYPLILNQDGSIKQMDKTGKSLPDKFNNPARGKHRDIMKTIAATGELPAGSNAIFLTYSQVNKKNLQRDLLSALGDKAYFVLDESHNAAGDFVTKIPQSKGGGERQTTAGFFAEVIGAGNVTYLSATYAKRPDNMPIYFRTDLIDAVDNMGELISAVEAGGVPLQTVMSNMLAESGQLFRRERSFEGIEIKTVVNYEDSAKHQAIYNEVTEGLRAVTEADQMFQDYFLPWAQDNAEEVGAKVKMAGNRATASVDHQNFTSIVHNYISQLLMSMKADGVVQNAVRLHNGGKDTDKIKSKKPVIATDNTMESFIDKMVEKYGLKVGDAFEFDYRDILLVALERTRRLSVKDDKGDSQPVQIEMSELDGITREAYENAEAAINALDIGDLPVSPIDYVRQELVSNGIAVSEITGRDLIIDYSGDKPVLAKRDSKERKDKRTTVDKFNTGLLDALILNQSGSTGLSIHASEKFVDQKPRHMMVMQASLDINIMMQMLGRINRTGQTVLPEYTLMALDLPAEKRPAAILSEKMRSLNANTSANSDSDTSIDAPNILNKYGNKIVNDFLTENPSLARKLGLTVSKEGNEPPAELSRKFTGRMALMPVSDQDAAYTVVESEYKSLIEFLDKTGQNDLNPQTLDLDARIVSSSIIYQGKDPKSVFGGNTTLHEINSKYQGKPPKPDDVSKAIDKGLGDQSPEQATKAILAKKKTEGDRYESDITARVDEIEKKWKSELHKDKFGDLADKYEGRKGLQSVIAVLEESDDYGKEHKLTKKYQSFSERMEGYGETLVQYEESKQETEGQLNRIYKLGNHIKLDVGDELVTGVVTGIKDSHKTGIGNPYSPSKTKVTIMVNSGIRQVVLPLSQLTQDAGIYQGLLKTKGKQDLDSIFEPFMETGERRETRYVATGNLIAGSADLKQHSGRIVSFTGNDGQIYQGILLPKKYKHAQSASKIHTLPLRDPVKTAQFLMDNKNDQVISAFGIRSKNGKIALKSKGDKWVILLPQANKDALVKTVKFDKQLRQAMGTDFYTAGGGNMVASFTDQQLSDVVQSLFDLTPMTALGTMDAQLIASGMDIQTEAVQGFDERAVAEASDPQARYNLVAEGQKPTGIKSYEVKTLQKQLTRAIGDVATVVQNESQLPKHLYDQIKTDGVQGRVKGVYDPKTDTVYIVASNAESLSDGMRTALHEAVGHKGLRGVLGSSLNKTLDQIYDSLPDSQIRQLRKEYANQIAGKPQEEQRRIVAEEYLAHLAETDPQNNLVQRVIAKIKQWMRQYLPSLKWTDADIRNLMIEASQKAKDDQQDLASDSTRPMQSPATLRYQLDIDYIAKNIRKGIRAAKQILKSHKDVKAAMHRPDIGDIDLIWGTEGGWPPKKKAQVRKGQKGLAHIIEARIRKNKLSEAEAKDVLFKVIETIAKGDIVQRNRTDVNGITEERVKIEMGPYVASLVNENIDGSNHYLLSGFENSASGETRQVHDRPSSTHDRPTLYRSEVGAEAEPNINDSTQQKQDTPDSSRYKLSALNTMDTAQVKQEIGRSASSLKESIRSNALGWLGGRQLTDLYSKVFDSMKGINPLKEVGDLTQKLAASRSLWANMADKIDNNWARLAADKHSYQQTNDLMYESTIAEVDPSIQYEPKHDIQELKQQHNSAVYAGDGKVAAELEAKIQEEEQRQVDYDRLQKRYELLPDKAKEVFTEVRDYYQSQWKATRDALFERIKGMGLDGDTTASIRQQVDALFHQSLSKGPYFPLMRFGQFAVVGETPEGKPFRQHFESEKAMKDGIDALTKGDKPHIIESSGKVANLDASQMSGVTAMTSKIQASLTGGKLGGQLDDNARMAFMDEINQMALSLLPELSAAKRSLHRKKIAGYDTNARRSFATVSLHGANRLGRIKYGWQIDEQLDRMDEVTDASKFSPLSEDEKIIGHSVAAEMRKRHDLNMNPNGSPIASHITNAAFIMYLGASVGAGLVNMTQNILVALPQLGSRYGYAKTSRAMAKASKDYFAFGGQKPKGIDGLLRDSWFNLAKAKPNQHITQDEIDLIQQLIDDGTIDTTQAHTLAQIADSDIRPDAQKTRDWYTKMTRGAGLFFHNAEVSNRQIAALTAYRLFKENSKGSFDPQKGVEFARKAVFDAHFDYSGYNRPRHFKGNWSKVLLIFKQHSQNMTYNLTKTFYDGVVSKETRGTEEGAMARRTLLGTLGLHAMFAGVMGLPGMSVMLYGASLAMGDDDDPVDPEVELRNVFADWFGVTNGHALAKGVFNGYFNMDVHSRTSLNDLWVRSPGYDMPARQEAMYYVTNSIGGPAVSQIINSVVGLDEMVNGNSMKGLQRMMPKFIRDGLKTIEYSDQGVVDRDGKVINDNMTPAALAWQAIGIGTASTSESYDARGAVLNPKAKVTKRKSLLLSQLDRAVRNDDQQLYKQTEASIERFNEVQRANKRNWAVITRQGKRRSLAYKKKAREESKTGIVLPKSQLGMREYARSFDI